jgi:hypothetical protein
VEVTPIRPVLRGWIMMEITSATDIALHVVAMALRRSFRAALPAVTPMGLVSTMA